MSQIRGIPNSIVMYDDNNWEKPEMKTCVTCDHFSKTNPMYSDFEESVWCMRTRIPKIVKNNHHCGAWINETERILQRTW